MWVEWKDNSYHFDCRDVRSNNNELKSDVVV